MKLCAPSLKIHVFRGDLGSARFGHRNSWGGRDCEGVTDAVAVGVSDDGDSTEQSSQILQGYNHINLPVQIGSISINMPTRF